MSERLKDTVFHCPALYVYDSYPGGTGLSEGFLENAAEILQGALELVAACSCAHGCPSCIGPVGAEPLGPGAETQVGNPKESIREFLSAWLGKKK